MQSSILKLARKAIENYLKTGKTLDCPSPLPKEFNKKAGVFVSIHTRDGNLRGCIGTFLPAQKNLAKEIIENAISAISRDPRFPAVGENELSDLEISVDILSKSKQIKNIKELNVKKYGVIVKSQDGRTGLLLPNLEGIETPEQQITIASQKAGISLNEKIKVYKFTVERFKE